MSIRVESTTHTETPSGQASELAPGQEKSGAGDPNPSAPEAKASEQKDPADSDTADPEAKEQEGEKEEPESKDASEKDGPKKKGGWQRRIEKLVSQREEERRKNAELEARLARLEAAGGRGSEKPAEPSKDAEPAGKPSPESFETHAEYVEALTDWKIEQRDKAIKEQAAKAQLETEHGKLIQAHSQRVQAFAEKTPDYDETIMNLDDVPVTAAFEQIILESENGPALLYELAKDPKEAKRIARLSPLAAARELGKVEARLTAHAQEPRKQESKPVTKAPRPIAPVGGKGASVDRSIYDAEKLSQREYEELRAKQRRA